MKQEREGRLGMRMPGGVVAGVLILLWMAGCNPADRSGLSEPEQPTDPSQVTGVTAVTPSEFTVGSIVEISGYGLPLDLNRVRVSFRGITDQVTGGVRGYPIRVTPNLITVVTPTAVPTGLVTVSVQGEDGGFLQLEPRSVTAGPELTGYLVPTPRRVAGVVEGDQFEIATPQIIVYGRNIDMGVASADVRVLSADRRSVVYSASFSLDTGNRGIPVPGVGDPGIRGVSITLPRDVGRVLTDGLVTYIEVLVRAGSLVSNVIQIPAVNRGWNLPAESTFSSEVPLPAFISGVWCSAGVHGSLIEVYYTIFQAYARFKWSPALEFSVDRGSNWTLLPAEALVAPEGYPSSSEAVLDYIPEMVIAGHQRQKSDKRCMGGPGSTYRLLIDPWQALDPGFQGQVRFRLTMQSVPTSHGEVGDSGSALLGRIEGNRFELPFVAVSPPVLTSGLITEAFADRLNFLERDTLSGLDSTGQWGGGTARGTLPATPEPSSGRGTHDLNETVLDAGRSYLFDTDSGVLFAFPADASQALVETVRASRGSDPTTQGLTVVWTLWENPGAYAGELHVASLAVPAGVKIYARGGRPFVVRVNGTRGGLAARIDGEIIVDGLPATEGTWDDDDGVRRAQPGTGGIGGPGGGDGGSGGVVRVGTFLGTLEVDEALPATAGEWGGGPGQTIAYVLPENTGGTVTQPRCFVYGGAGGGGGFGTEGRMGRPSNRTDGTNNRTAGGNPWAGFGRIHRVCGPGGPARGSNDLMVLLGGSGGGGGGGFLSRKPIDAQRNRIFGSGGGGGGGGGGVFKMVVDGSVEIGGRIVARGGLGAAGRARIIGSGAAAQRGEWAGGCGGGGSGGAVLVQATEAVMFRSGAEIDVSGGDGGRPGTTTDPAFLTADGYPIGGDGGAGRIRLEAARGVNLPSNINFSGVTPSISDDGAATAGPILRAVWGGNGAHGALNLAEYPNAVDGIFYAVVGELNTPALFYENAAGERVDVIRSIIGIREFNFTSLVIPEGTVLRGIGATPIIVRVQRDAVIHGTVDVSGTDGGPVEIVDDVFIAGSGGLGGPGGGGGAAGGFGSLLPGTETWEITSGKDGGVPAGVVISEFGDYLPESGWDDRELPERVLVARGGMSFEPSFCGGDCMEFTGHHGGGGGGGAFGEAGFQGPQPPGSLFSNGRPGTRYGAGWFLADGVEEPFLAGSGGGGGGASTNIAGTESAAAGSGGGGGGGCFVLAVAGNLHLGQTARIDASGGNAYKAAVTGGAGGGGAGGAILLRTNGTLDMDLGAVITASGGTANVPFVYRDSVTGRAYVASDLNTGGNGAFGRIRIEYPGGGLTGGDVAAVVLKPDGVVASVGTMFQGDEVVSWVWSRPLPLAIGSGAGLVMQDWTVQVGSAIGQLVRSEFISSVVRWQVMIDGGEAYCGDRTAPDRMFGPMSHFGSLNAVGLKPAYVRFLIGFVSSSTTGEVPELRRIDIPVGF